MLLIVVMLTYLLYCILLITNFSLISTPTCYIALEQKEASSSFHTGISRTCNSKVYSSHFYDKHNNLFAYSSGQLKDYFYYHNYSEKDILAQSMLYASDEF